MTALYQDPGASNSTETVACKHIHTSQYLCDPHAHEEVEIMLALSHGTHRRIGETFATMQPGDLVIVGPFLSHQFSNSIPGSRRPSLMQAVSVKFNPSQLGTWLQSPEFIPLQSFLRNSTYGYDVQDPTRQIIAEKLPNLLETQGLQRLIQLLEILQILSHNQHHLHQITSPGCSPNAPTPVHQRLQRLTRFLKKNLSEPLYLQDVAQHLGVSPVSLSRYLRTHLKKTFPSYLNELRITRVCHLLRETDNTISEIAALCGFESMANFERQFRKHHHCSPKKYRQHFHSQLIASSQNLPKKQKKFTLLSTKNTCAA